MFPRSPANCRHVIEQYGSIYDRPRYNNKNYNDSNNKHNNKINNDAHNSTKFYCVLIFLPWNIGLPLCPVIFVAVVIISHTPLCQAIKRKEAVLLFAAISRVTRMYCLHNYHRCTLTKTRFSLFFVLPITSRCGRRSNPSHHAVPSVITYWRRRPISFFPTVHCTQRHPDDSGLCIENDLKRM